jgi:hypothetical protein
MEYLGLDAPLRADSQGNLVLTTSLGEVKEQAPYAYQMDGRTQKRVESTYHIIDGNRVAFEFNRFDANKELVIDPLLYGTYWGGSGIDECQEIAASPDGSVYVAGLSNAMSGFPTTPGAYDETGNLPGSRLFCSKFGADGEFVASTLFGAIQSQENPNTSGGVWDMEYDSARSGLWIGGFAREDNWPLSSDAFDTAIDEIGDGFIVRFNDSLTTLQYCTYLGGDHRDFVTGLSIGDTGYLYFVGGTYSTDFPVTMDAFSDLHQENDCFVWVYDFDSHQVVFSTYFGGSNADYAPADAQYDQNHILWFTARTESEDLPITQNAFQRVNADTLPGFGEVMISGISLDPPSIVYCSYLGGSQMEEPLAFKVEDSLLYVAGRTSSRNFPVSSSGFDTTGPDEVAPNYWDGFVSRINWHTNEYYGTFFGGDGGDGFVKNVDFDHGTTLTLLGWTESDDLPVTTDAYQTLPRFTDGFITKFSADLSHLSYCTYFGGSGVDNYESAFIMSTDCLWAVGSTLSNSFPITANAIQPNRIGLSDGFVQHFAIDTTGDTTSTSHNAPVPKDFTLTVFPNPFNPTTTLSFSLPQPSTTELTIHNILGQQIEHIDFGKLQAGHHTQQIGHPTWSTGLYFATLKTPNYTKTTKLLLLR